MPYLTDFKNLHNELCEIPSSTDIDDIETLKCAKPPPPGPARTQLGGQRCVARRCGRAVIVREEGGRATHGTARRGAGPKLVLLRCVAISRGAPCRRRYFTPFLTLIQSGQTSCVVTLVALSSLNKFLLYGYLAPDSLQSVSVLQVQPRSRSPRRPRRRSARPAACARARPLACPPPPPR